MNIHEKLDEVLKQPVKDGAEAFGQVQEFLAFVAAVDEVSPVDISGFSHIEIHQQLNEALLDEEDDMKMLNLIDTIVAVKMKLVTND